MTAANHEVELKYLAPDLLALRARLRDLGAGLVEQRSLEVNLVWDDADGRLAATGRLLRLRNGHDLTVKLPVEDPRYKVREEIKVEIKGGDIERALEGLGYRVRFRYEKYREGWDMDGMFVTLDELPFIGQVVEIEGDRDGIDPAAEKLGLAHLRTSTLNYRSLYLEWAAAHGREPGDLTFEAEAAAAHGS
ncbi:MAG: class IV adenylate cyclase [Candidatus Dormibacteria bacterium]